jgi:hypothetical protein
MPLKTLGLIEPWVGERVNLLPFGSIFKFFYINMFASLRNQFSNYRTSSLRFDIEKNIIIKAFHHLASISMPLTHQVPTGRFRPPKT